MLPYDADALQALIGFYNRSLWPAQLLALAVAMLALLLVGRERAPRVVVALLVATWLWCGVVYQAGYYASLNWAGWLYGLLFVVQAMAMAGFGIVRRWRRVPSDRGTHAALGLALWVSLGEPLLELASTAASDGVLVVGFGPDATAAFSVGVVLALRGAPPALLALPVAWCGWSALWWWQLAVPMRMVLPLLTLLVLVSVVWLRRRSA